jgi:predicted DNA-binding protein
VAAPDRRDVALATQQRPGTERLGVVHDEHVAGAQHRPESSGDLPAGGVVELAVGRTEGAAVHAVDHVVEPFGQDEEAAVAGLDHDPAAGDAEAAEQPHQVGHRFGDAAALSHVLREAIAERVEELEDFYEVSARLARPHRRVPDAEVWADLDRAD